MEPFILAAIPAALLLIAIAGHLIFRDQPQLQWRRTGRRTIQSAISKTRQCHEPETRLQPGGSACVCSHDSLTHHRTATLKIQAIAEDRWELDGPMTGGEYPNLNAAVKAAREMAQAWLKSPEVQEKDSGIERQLRRLLS